MVGARRGVRYATLVMVRLTPPAADSFHEYMDQDEGLVSQPITAVRSTDIFCRAGCPAPAPLPGNV
jgi:methylphosphotriester-DNA--protein-cysteine methyltransferase